MTPHRPVTDAVAMEMIDELSASKSVNGFFGCNLCVVQIDEEANARHEEDCIKGKARALIAAVKGE